MKSIRGTEALRPDPTERRAEHRFDAEGEVSFSFEDPIRREITGRLMDYSKSGFRVAHKYSALVSGQVVDFHHVLAGGRAQVVWNRIVDTKVETGFVILVAHQETNGNAGESS